VSPEIRLVVLVHLDHRFLVINILIPLVNIVDLDNHRVTLLDYLLHHINFDIHHIG
jgi:hypothetical protein